MSLTTRELWTAAHGMIFGAAFLLLFTGCWVMLRSLSAPTLGEAGQRAAGRRLSMGLWSMALLAWMTVASGTFVVYPWYRAAPPRGTAGAALLAYPKATLVASHYTAEWHEFGMEWKEHVAWLAPLLATAAAAAATVAGGRGLALERSLRYAVLAFLLASFSAAAVAGALGALIDKAAPVR